MKEKRLWKNALGAAGIYTAVILGAGFASGQEIISYFVDYGKVGFYGILLSACLFGLVGAAVLSICHEKQIKNYNGFMDMILGRKIGRMMEIVLGLFMFILFSTMLAAAGAAVEEAFSLPFTTGVLIVGAMCFGAFLFEMKGIVAINAFLSPIMVFGSVFIGLYIFVSSIYPAFNSDGELFVKSGGNWVLSAGVYVSYNIITAVTILSSMGDKIDTGKTARLAGVLGGAVMGLLGFAIALPLYINYAGVKAFEIPLLHLVQKGAFVMEYLYMIVLTAAVFSSAATNGYAVIDWLCGRFSFHKPVMKAAVTLMGITAAYAGFSNFVSKVYPVFAAAGFIEILFILRYFIQSPGGRKAGPRRRKYYHAKEEPNTGLGR